LTTVGESPSADTKGLFKFLRTQQPARGENVPGKGGNSISPSLEISSDSDDRQKRWSLRNHHKKIKHAARTRGKGLFISNLISEGNQDHGNKWGSFAYPVRKNSPFCRKKAKSPKKKRIKI